MRELLQFFDCRHLPPHLREVAEPFARMAFTLVTELPGSEESDVALRKLLEAKDAAVRARVFDWAKHYSLAVGPSDLSFKDRARSLVGLPALPVTVLFEGGYPRYTATPKDGQSIWDFVFDCAVGLGSERLTSLMGNDQARFEIDGDRLTESDPASHYGGNTVTVVMVYDPTEED